MSEYLRGGARRPPLLGCTSPCYGRAAHISAVVAMGRRARQAAMGGAARGAACPARPSGSSSWPAAAVRGGGSALGCLWPSSRCTASSGTQFQAGGGLMEAMAAVSSSCSSRPVHKQTGQGKWRWTVNSSACSRLRLPLLLPPQAPEDELLEF